MLQILHGVIFLPPFATGLCAFLSIVLLVFTKDPHSCVPLFLESESKCVYTLGHLLDTDWLVLIIFFQMHVCYQLPWLEVTILFF